MNLQVQQDGVDAVRHTQAHVVLGALRVVVDVPAKQAAPVKEGRELLSVANGSVAGRV